jgi:GT2 family glycosyltransferase
MAPVTVIVHRERPESCIRTIRQLRDQTVPTEIVVVDNASTSSALAAIRAAADVRIIELDENRGFGPTANVGLRSWLAGEIGHDADWAFVAPHDALVRADTIERMLEVGAAEGTAGVLCADVGDQARPMIDRFFGALPGRALSYEGFEPVDYPHGTLLALRRECAADIGLFDERCFAYGEEADLGLRARAAGWQVGLVRDAMVANPTTSGSGALVDYLKHRNTLLLLREHAGRWPVAVRVATLGAQLVAGALAPARRPPWFDSRARRRALADYLRGRTGPPPDDIDSR